MSTEELFRSLMTIDGVLGCMLSHRDGRLVGHRMDNPAPLLALMKTCGNCLAELAQQPGFNSLQFVRFQAADQEHFYLFPVQQYYLGVSYRGAEDDRTLRATVLQRLESLRAARVQGT